MDSGRSKAMYRPSGEMRIVCGKRPHGDDFKTRAFPSATEMTAICVVLSFRKKAARRCFPSGNQPTGAGQPRDCVKNTGRRTVGVDHAHFVDCALPLVSDEFRIGRNGGKIRPSTPIRPASVSLLVSPVSRSASARLS